jgi:hypothetical protein
MRKKSQKDQAGAYLSLDYAYSDASGTYKVMTGFGAPAPVGALGSAYNTQLGTTMMFFNSDTAVHYVKFGGAAVTAPSGPADGIPLPPGQLVVMNIGPTNSAVISDSALVFGYTVGDETYCTPPTNI